MKYKIAISAEDEALKALAYRLLSFVFGESFEVTTDELPFRVTSRSKRQAIQNIITKLNKLADKQIVVVMIDSDGDCAKVIYDSFFDGLIKNQKLILNIAVDEAESWLLADPLSFSDFFNIPSEILPETHVVREVTKHNHPELEIYTSDKPTYFLLNEVYQNTNNTEALEALKPIKLVQGLSVKKNPFYNDFLRRYITTTWSIESASENSYSLRNAVRRLQSLKSHLDGYQ